MTIICPFCSTPNYINITISAIEHGVYVGNPVKMMCEHCYCESFLRIRVIAERIDEE